jgi:hypothetical protein
VSAPKVIAPAEMSLMPVIARSVDDLPTPLRPSTAVMRPGRHSMEMPLRAWAAP